MLLSKANFNEQYHAQGCLQIDMDIGDRTLNLSLSRDHPDYKRILIVLFCTYTISHVISLCSALPYAVSDHSAPPAGSEKLKQLTALFCLGAIAFQ